MLRLLAICLLVAACSHGPARLTGPVNHIVIVWLKEPGDIDAIARFIAMTKDFERIPGVIDQRVGKVLPSGRPIVDSSFDVAAVIRFQNEAALANYLQHPLHQKAVEEVLKPLVERVIVYDFVSD